METISLKEFQEKVNPTQVRICQLVHGTMIMSTVVLLILPFVVFYSKVGTHSNLNVAELLPAFTAINFVLLILTYFLNVFVHNVIVSPKRLYSSEMLKSNWGIQDKIMGIITRGIIVRGALLQSPAVFGMIVTMFSIITKSVEESPFLWSNMLSIIIIIAALIYTFPTRAKIEQIFINRFIQVDNFEAQQQF